MTPRYNSTGKNEIPEAEVEEVKEEAKDEAIPTPEMPPIPEFTAEPVDETHIIEETERTAGPSESFGFQAETKKLLDIVARSLYTDKEVFVRELISNASDASEKLRHLTLTGGEGKISQEEGVELEVLMSADAEKNTFTIQDFGIGMTKEDLIQNLGTIAHSGSQKFAREISEGGSNAKDIIGQFGVGFYAAFMVADKVKVYSRHCAPGSQGYLWESDGLGNFSITEAEGVARGTKIIVYLKRSENTFSKKLAIENIIKKYSNFVSFPIKLNGETINTVKALWSEPKGTITEEQHKEFYQFIARAYDEPKYSFHYATDSPLQIQSLFYVPDQHQERYGMGKMDPGISLYCRRVLIQGKCRGILPDWLRFVKGVVDSEDIPLNLSREHLQDSALIGRISTVLTRRFLKFMNEEAKSDPENYQSFYNEYSNFLKEGIITDHQYKEEIAKLLRSESSHSEPGKETSLDEYVDRMPSTQQSIYYLFSTSRTFAEKSPYLEIYQRKGLEVLFFYSELDDPVLANLATFRGKKLESIETASDLPDKDDDEDDSHEKDESVVKDFNRWIRDTLEDKVSVVKESNRVSKSPALIVDHQSAAVRRIMSRMDPNNKPRLPRQNFEYNLKHPIMKKINELRFTNEPFAEIAIEQVFDNALIAAGLLDDPRGMLDRLNDVLETALDHKSGQETPKEGSGTPLTSDKLTDD
jgi:HSP90 family molecular chaperone